MLVEAETRFGGRRPRRGGVPPRRPPPPPRERRLWRLLQRRKHSRRRERAPSGVGCFRVTTRASARRLGQRHGHSVVMAAPGAAARLGRRVRPHRPERPPLRQARRREGPLPPPQPAAPRRARAPAPRAPRASPGSCGARPEGHRTRAVRAASPAATQTNRRRPPPVERGPRFRGLGRPRRSLSAPASRFRCGSGKCPSRPVRGGFLYSSLYRPCDREGVRNGQRERNRAGSTGWPRGGQKGQKLWRGCACSFPGGYWSDSLSPWSQPLILTRCPRPS